MIHKGCSERSDGNMYLSRDGFDFESVANRERYFRRIGLTEKKIVVANLVHGMHVACACATSPEFLLDTDALVTKEKDIVLTLTGADCFPVYFEDTTDGIIGLAHCGWKGIVSGILEETIRAIESLASEKSWIPGQARDDKNKVAKKIPDPSKGGQAIRDDKNNIRVTIGPGICTEHFEIKEDILPHFAKYPDAILRKDDRLFVDLRAIIKTRLRQLGIADERIIDQGECTYCLPEKYFSYRRDKPERLETQVAYIMQ